MSRERERYRIGRRISIYREWRMWMLDASFPNGDRLRCSLKTQEEPEAFKRAHLFLLEWSKIYRDFPLSFQNDLLWDSIKQEITSEDLESAFTKALGSRLPAQKSVEDSITEYLAFQTGTKSNDEDWVRNVGGQLRMFVTFSGVKTIQEITSQIIANYLADCTTKGQKPKTRKEKLGIIRAWLEWGMRFPKYVTENVADAVPVPVVAKQDVVYLTSEEIGKVLKAVQGDLIAPLVACAIYGGLRREELAQLEAEDVNLAKRVLRVRNKESWSVKTKRARNVPIFDQLAPFLEGLPSKGSIFVAERGGPWVKNLDRLSERVRELLEPVVGHEKAQLQVLRHTFVTHCLLSGVDPYVVARWAGHDVRIQQDRYAGYALGEEPLSLTYKTKKLDRQGVSIKEGEA
jgi:integrase